MLTGKITILTDRIDLPVAVWEPVAVTPSNDVNDRTIRKTSAAESLPSTGMSRGSLQNHA